MLMVLLLLIPAVLYVLSLRGRSGHPVMEELKKWRYAHRGLHDEGKPENSMAAFRSALDHGYGIELDLHLLKDGNLAVLHDSALQRITGRDGIIEDLATADLKEYHLSGTEQTIPEFRQVLELYAGKAPLIIELKSHGGNYAQLTETACRMMEGYTGLYCIESFDPRCVRWLRKNRPEIVRGQLSENFLRSGSEYPLITRLITTFCMENFLTRPDFIAYRFEHRKTLSNFLCRKLWHLSGVSWTIRTKADFDTAVQEGWIPIFEKFIP